MTAPSYASAAAKVSNPTTPIKNGNGHYNNPKTSTFDSQVQELSHPHPQSMTLMATLQLLEPLETQDVFLMTRSYLQNWLIWASHQKVQKTETARVEAAVWLAADRMGFTVPPQQNSIKRNYSEPGPINASKLSIEGHPMLLRPNVKIVKDGIDHHHSNVDTEFPALIRRVKSLPDAESPENEIKSGDSDSPEQDSQDVEGNPLLCCAVPQTFYETLRSVHGVVCNDGFSISFQPFQRDSEALLHHHSHAAATAKENGLHNSLTTNGVKASSPPPRPIEFRRQVIMKQPASTALREDPENCSSPMTKLLMEQKKLNQPRMVPSVEVYPVKLNYTVVDGKNQNKSSQGFVLVSRRTMLYDALQGLMKVAAPKTSSSGKRIWSKREKKATSSGDGYEVVDLSLLDGKILPKKEEEETTHIVPQLLTGEWINTHGDVEVVKEIDVLVEVKRSNDKWSRESLESANRIQVGDFVDAQDAAGNWYESLVREVTEDTVTVHYFGWASRWDSVVRRRPNVEISGSAARIRAPAPLWTHSYRWRENLTEGKVVEVRDTSSRVDRPKWYKGIVRKIGARKGKVFNTDGGAELELFEDPESNGSKVKKPLLLLGQTRQIMVEVEQERQNNPALITAWNNDSDSVSVDTLKPQPPILRWVNLYGEEICEPGTHMKLESDGDIGVVTLRYEYDAGRKPVEVMKSWNNMYGQGFVKESLRGTPPAAGSVGMHNLGNSCFLNSILQCLNHIEALTNYFVKGDYMHDLNRSNPLGSGGRVATAYASLLKEIWGGKYSALAPRMLKQTVANFAPQFNNSYQHDSQEFCQFLMDGLHEDCNRVKNKPYVEELEGFGMEDEKAAVETWRKHLLRHDSAIVDCCQGMHRSHLTCPSCGRESIKFDVFSTISLPITGEKETTVIKLEDCIEKFMEGEQLDELNAWYCAGCKKHVCALKMIALWSVPDVLILHLKRFQFDHCSVSNEVLRSKIDDTVKFPIDGLDLRSYVLGPIDEEAPPVYKLFGVSEHSGATANSGHYTATVRNSKDGRWYRYNDAHVGETTGDAAVTGGAYLLFYQRTRGKARWAGLEKVMADKEIDPYGGLETDQDGFTRVKTKKKKNG